MTRLLPRLLQRPAPLRLFALALVALVVGSFVTLLPGLHRSLEEASADPLWRLAAARSEGDERRVVVVRIDEDSLARVGSWPWPREQLARLAQALAREGARVQLMDIVFPEARPGDEAFIAALQAQPLFLGQVFSPAPDASRVGSLAGALPGLGCAPSSPRMGGYVANNAAFARAAGGGRAGHITPTLDPDGTVRRIAPLLCHQQRSYAALGLLGLAALAEAAPAPALAFEAGRGLLAPHGWVSLPQLGLKLPVDADGSSRLPFAHAAEVLVSVPAADVLDGRVPAGLLRGAIALVGATAFGIGDTVATPLAPNAPGVEIHARLIAAALDGALVHTPQGAALFQLGLAVLAALGLGLLAGRQRSLPAFALPLAGLAFAVVACAVHGVALLRAGWWIGWLAPAAFALLAGLALAVVEFARARLERERLYHNLASYLPEQVAAQVALREPVGTIDAERREITVLFADLRNFSAYCEARPPEEAAALLHAFFSTAHRVVTAHRGVVEEFVGDAVMAIWNAPQACPGHPQHALEAAHALLREVAALLPEQAPPGLEPLALGIGIETGKALVGSFGAAERRTHAALGETVTVAARLQAMTADLSSDIVVGPGAAAQLPAAALVSVGSFLLEGLQRPRTLHVPAPRAGGEQTRRHIRLVA